MNEVIKLWNNRQIVTKQAPPSITTYLLDDGAPHGAILVIPGGGYGCVCESTEGYAIARRFNELGFHTLVLNYRCQPHRYPEPQQDALRAMKIIRGSAEAWKIIPDQIAACGFSAGGHLTGCLGTLQDEAIDASDQDEYDAVDPWPTALIMGYPVISLEGWSNVHTGKNLLGDQYAELNVKYSLQYRINEKTPPSFVWCTFADQMVPYQNSLLFADVMGKAGRPCELHVFPYGAHGMLLGIDTIDVGQWTSLAANFLRTQWKRQSLAEGSEERKAFDDLYTNAVQAKLEPPR